MLLYTIIGHQRGFVASVAKTFGWILGIWLAAKWMPLFTNYVLTLTDIESPFTQKAVAFAAGLVVVKLALFALMLLFSRKYHEGDFIGRADSVLGAAFGFAAGVLFVMVAVMLLPAACDLLKSEELADQLAQSNLSLYILQRNPLHKIVTEISNIKVLQLLDFQSLKALGSEKLKELILNNIPKTM